jgi:hypothetical protein
VCKICLENIPLKDGFGITARSKQIAYRFAFEIDPSLCEDPAQPILSPAIEDFPGRELLGELDDDAG